MEGGEGSDDIAVNERRREASRERLGSGGGNIKTFIYGHYTENKRRR